MYYGGWTSSGISFLSLRSSRSLRLRGSISFKEGWMAERVEFGWKAPEFPADGSDNAAMIRQTFEVLDLIEGRFDAAWVTDHVLPWARWQAVYVLFIACWTTITFLYSIYLDFR